MAPLPQNEWSDRERDLLRGNLASADRYLSGDPDSPPMPPILGLLARHAAIGGPWLGFSAALIESGSLAPRDRELLILRVAVRTGCRYLLAEHLRLAVAVGLSQAELDAIGEGAESKAWRDADRLLMQTVDDLVEGHVISQATWGDLTGHYEERLILEILFLTGSYVCLAMVLNTAGLEPQI